VNATVNITCVIFLISKKNKNIKPMTFPNIGNEIFIGTLVNSMQRVKKIDTLKIDILL
jgi:hypothetical protein